MIRLVRLVLSVACGLAAVLPSPALAQDHAHMTMAMPGASGWTFMQDGVVWGLFNRQGGPRGGTDWVAPNWWMGMASRTEGRQQITLHAMFSLDPATVGTSGYREIFQVGEMLHGAPLIDRQHPHDFFMQLTATWRITLATGTALTISGGPSGEPALGPVAFMHRPSAAGLPLAPLSHHTFDSTHVSFGVATVGVDHGPWTVEASAFNGREPDEHRWAFDFGPLDSFATRLSLRPTSAWTLQVSTGHLHDPEVLEPGNVQRTTASASWQRTDAHASIAITAGYGINVTPERSRQAAFGEFTFTRGPHAIFGRVESVQVETARLLTGEIPATPREAAELDAVGAITGGVSRRVLVFRRFDAVVGAAATTYVVPEQLKNTHGDHPASFQVFFRLALRHNEEASAR